ncbi:hypothetical protein AAG570_010386 [Ranatra chinensis]|uniref:Uncharacterized protein n=1 Tax=Ranatra chinensis TaxID=642074 RepID=A0ABD0YME8_9HEMI
MALDEEHLKSKEQVETHVKKYGEDKWLLGNAGSFVQDFMGLTKDDNTCDLPYYDILTKASLLRSQDVENENFGIKFSGSSPSGSLQKNEIMEGSPRVSTTVATVHATENTKSVMPKSSQENLDDHYQSNTFESSVVHPNDESSEELFVSATEENVEDGNCSDEKGEDDSAGDEPWWVVQKVEAVNKKIENVFLILLDNELREKNTYNTQITTKWSLEKIQSCVKVKSDPVTIELEFDSVRIDKQSRTYIMEYADAKKAKLFVQFVMVCLSLKWKNLAYPMKKDCLKKV